MACIIISGMTIPGFFPEKGTLIIKLTDAPVDLDRLIVIIDRVSIRKGNDEEWVDLPFVPPEPGAYAPTEVSFDLLELKDVTKDLCVAEIPSGEYAMIELHIKAPAIAHFEVDPAKPVELKIPSDSVMIILKFEVEKEQVTTILIDMEADWLAISENGVLRPVLKALVL